MRLQPITKWPRWVCQPFKRFFCFVLKFCMSRDPLFVLHQLWNSDILEFLSWLVNESWPVNQHVGCHLRKSDEMNQPRKTRIPSPSLRVYSLIHLTCSRALLSQVVIIVAEFLNKGIIMAFIKPVCFLPHRLSWYWPLVGRVYVIIFQVNNIFFSMPLVTNNNRWYHSKHTVFSSLIRSEG